MFIVFEGDFGAFKFAAPFDVNVLRRVDEDVGDGRVCEQGFERAESEKLVARFLD